MVEFPLPTSLLLANYFRDLAVNHSVITQPLQAIVVNYHKNMPLWWMMQLIATIYSVHKVPPAELLNEKLLPLILHTDASDYGIDANLLFGMFQKTPQG